MIKCLSCGNTNNIDEAGVTKGFWKCILCGCVNNVEALIKMALRRKR